MANLYPVVVLSIILTTTCSSGLEITFNLTQLKDLHRLPRFWTNTGFCPMGSITNDDISNSLLSKDVKTNLDFISALPNNAISKVRVHWLLELVRFQGFRTRRVPVYDFTLLDQFLDHLIKLNISVGFEIMGNPNEMFDFKNVSSNALWQDLIFSIGRRYKIRYGTKVVKSWQFETWNEPDLKTYNLLNFSLPDYLDYIKMIRRGLDAVGRTVNNTRFELSGPAGLFKNATHHPLCWGALKYCSGQKTCPFDQITFHRKGREGNSAQEIIDGGLDLIKSIHNAFPKLKTMKISNNEADPTSGWSTPRSFQSDVRYAVTLVDIILRHWSAKLNTEEFRYLETISHDNAFLSYHPFEFEQRTLLARFQMNRTQPPHSQFIQKPVYGALGLLGNLGEFADDILHVQDTNITLLSTRGHPIDPFYSAIVILNDGDSRRVDLDLNIFSPGFGANENIASIVEVIETDITDPVKIWRFYGSPAYPNATIRRLMRDNQGPIDATTRIHKSHDWSDQSPIRFNLTFKTPSVALLRICSSKNNLPPKPLNLRAQIVNHSEVSLFWSEPYQAKRCIKTYQVYFKRKDENEWTLISERKHIPFLSFQFQPADGKIQGQYKVRGVDLFQRFGLYSDEIYLQ